MSGDKLFQDCGDTDCSREQTLGAMVALANQMERERDEARERAGNLSVELAAMTQNRDELRRAVNRVARERDSAEEERNHAQERAWGAESSLAAIMALKQAREGGR